MKYFPGFLENLLTGRGGASITILCATWWRTAVVFAENSTHVTSATMNWRIMLSVSWTKPSLKPLCAACAICSSRTKHTARSQNAVSAAVNSTRAAHCTNHATRGKICDSFYENCCGIPIFEISDVDYFAQYVYDDFKIF